MASDDEKSPSNELETLLNRWGLLKLTQKNCEVKEVCDNLFQIIPNNDGTQVKNEDLFSYILKFIYDNDDTRKMNCCTFHAHKNETVRFLLNSQIDNWSTSEPIAADDLFELLELAMLGYDWIQTYNLWGAPVIKAMLQPIVNAIPPEAETVEVVRFIPLSSFVENYMPPRPVAVSSVYQADGKSLTALGNWYKHILSDNERSKQIWSSKYGSPRGCWGAHRDKDRSPSFETYCRHSVAFTGLKNEVQNFIQYREKNLAGMLDLYGIAESYRKPHYVEATYSAPFKSNYGVPFDTKEWTGLRKPVMSDARCYPLWRPFGHSLDMKVKNSSPGLQEFVHPPIRIDEEKFAFRFWEMTS